MSWLSANSKFTEEYLLLAYVKVFIFIAVVILKLNSLIPFCLSWTGLLIFIYDFQVPVSALSFSKMLWSISTKIVVGK